MLVTKSVKEVFEQLSQVLSIWAVLKLEASNVLHVLGELLRMAFAQRVDLSGQFLVPNLLILFLLGLGGKSLPGKAAAKEVDEDKAQRLKIVSSRLLDT